LEPQAQDFLGMVASALVALGGNWIVLGVLGLLVGSFLNVVVYRTPIILLREWLLEVGGLLADPDAWRQVFGRPQPADITAAGLSIDRHLEGLAPLSLSAPRSRCGACGHQIRWYENIPLVSWLVLRARCSACKTPIAARYPLVELATGALFAGLAWRYGAQPLTPALCAAAALLVAMALIDHDTKYLPDHLTYPLMWGGLMVSALGWSIPLGTAFWGVVAGFGPLWLISSLYKLLRGVHGMGGGDLKLLAALGAWFGWQAILPILLMSSIAGLCVNVPRKLLAGDADGTQYPFGPFLVGGGLVVMFVGADALLSWVGIQLPR
jgi:leader peptidase (prepilin peptidase) / N-methyltransferase